ncbi:hypothetical protein [uncultured Mediterranean phage uvMED]|nr:hypothetical protein [uncultured Mediterranean phage uvMED]
MSEVGLIGNTRHNYLFSQMTEVQAALIGAAATAFVMVLSNMSNRREKTIIDIYTRLNKLSQAVSRIEGKIQ